MLSELRIRDFAIIDSLTLTFGKGFTVLSGETGAGKSIIAGSLEFVLGARAYSELVKTGRSEATVEAFFEHETSPVLDEQGIAHDEGIMIRRVITSAGKSKAYINGAGVVRETLHGVGKTLVDLHGQHEHQSLLSPDNQLCLLDGFGTLDKDRERVGELFGEAQALRARIGNIKKNMQDRDHRIDLLQFQTGEIEAAGLVPGEDEALAQERAILSNMGKLNELLNISYGALHDDDGSCMETLSGSIGRLREMSAIDAQIAPVAEALENALPVIEDAVHTLRGFREKYQMDPERQAVVEDRLEIIRRLKKKYGASIGEILGHAEAARSELDSLNTSGEELERLEAELADRQAKLDLAAAELTRKRDKAARSLERALKPVFAELSLEKAEFKIAIREAALTANGADSIEFLFSANAGESPKPLGKVASGGELSRIMLSLKTVLRGADTVGLLVFDEVDAGIGGKTALNVAHKLRALSQSHQVIVITHLPQIASLADRHYLIEKTSEKSAVRVSVREISGSARQEEIARMLSGSVTEASLRHAKELIEGEL